MAHHMLAIERDEHVGERCERRRRLVAVRREEEDPPEIRVAGQVANQQQRRLVGPVQIVEHEQDRRRGTQLGQEQRDRFEHAEPHRLRVAPARSDDTRNPVAQFRHQRAELGRAPAQPVLDRVGGQRVQVGAQCLRDRLVRPQCLLVAAPEQHRAAALVGGGGELGREPRLADPGLTTDQHQARAERAGGVPLPCEIGELRAPADERILSEIRERRGQRHLRAAGEVARPARSRLQRRKVAGQLRVAELVHTLGAHEPAELVHPHVAQRHLARQLVTDDLRRGFRHHDLAPVREAAQPRTPVHRRTLVVPVRELGFARVEGHPHADRRAGGPRLGVERALERERALDRLTRTREHRKRAVALALVPRDAPRRTTRDARQPGRRAVRTRSAPHRGRTPRCASTLRRRSAGTSPCPTAA